jgi:hypothetical protein
MNIEDYKIWLGLASLLSASIFLVSIIGAAMNRKGESLFTHGGLFIFIWLVFPYGENGVEKKHAWIVWWARFSFIACCVTGYYATRL